MKEIGEICAKHGVLFMSDATQAVGKIPVDPKETGVHLMAFTSHKMYGPKGVGALYVRRRRPTVPTGPTARTSRRPPTGWPAGRWSTWTAAWASCTPCLASGGAAWPPAWWPS